MSASQHASRMRYWVHRVGATALWVLLFAAVGFLSNLASLHKLRSLARRDLILMNRAGAPAPNWLAAEDVREVTFAEDLPCPNPDAEAGFSTLQWLLLPHHSLRPKDRAKAGPVWAYLEVDWSFFPFLAQTRLGSYEGMEGQTGWYTSSFDRFTCHLCLFGVVIEVTSGGSGCISP
jgi:hypothetical protein